MNDLVPRNRNPRNVCTEYYFVLVFSNLRFCASFATFRFKLRTYIFGSELLRLYIVSSYHFSVSSDLLFISFFLRIFNI